MKIGMVSVTFREKTIPEIFEVARKAGLEGIEWGVCPNHVQLLDTAKAEAIHHLSKQYGIPTVSLGSYCHMDDLQEAYDAVETAVMLKAPIIRIWAGKVGSKDSDAENRAIIIENTIKMAEKAEEYGIKIGFEYHGNTLTDTPQSAVKLVQDIHMEHVGLYWQPSGNISLEENLSHFHMVKPYLIGNLHVHNYSSQDGYMPLRDVEENIKAYYRDIRQESYHLLIEFVKDDCDESLVADAEFLRKILY